MFAPTDFALTEMGNRAFAALSALAVSAVLMATAIVPATPTLGVLA